MKSLVKKLKAYNTYYPVFFTIVFIIVLTQYSFTTLESIFYDLRVKSDFGISNDVDIVIVTMDDESDEFLGETYPYTYATHVRFLQNIEKENPAVINFLPALYPPGNENEVTSSQHFKAIVEDLNDRGTGFRFGTEMDAYGEQLPPVNLRPLGYSLALLNRDSTQFSRDDVSRRAILNISGEDSLHLWTANYYRKKIGAGALQLRNILGAYYVNEADATFTLFRFAVDPTEQKRELVKIPYHRVVVGNFPRGLFSNKIVIIGSQYISSTEDYILTPFNKEIFKTPKINLHAIIIDSLIKNKTAVLIPKWVSNLLSIVLAIFLSVIIFRVNPTKGLYITIGSMFLTVLLSFVIFSVFGLWIYLVHIILSIFIVYYICVPFRTISEYQKRYAVQEETKLLKEVDRLKRNFLSLMSHDLKTPVARIAGMTHILLNQHENNNDQKKLLTEIGESTKELNSFITSILDLTKIESKSMNFNQTTKDVNKIIEQVIDKLTYDAEQKKVEIETELSPLYPITIDVELIRRVITNLVENAIKYSGEDKTIKITTWDDEKWVFIEIKDNGVGIKSEDLGHIFEKFYRVKNDTSHKVKGSGLGLYLVKYFVELHEGHISASSIVGEGTTFTIKLKNA